MIAHNQAPPSGPRLTRGELHHGNVLSRRFFRPKVLPWRVAREKIGKMEPGRNVQSWWLKILTFHGVGDISNSGNVKDCSRRDEMGGLGGNRWQEVGKAN